MKRVGICACYDTKNYGSMLQAFATQYVIDKLGYDSEFIVYKKKITPYFVFKQIPRLFNMNLMADKKMYVVKKIHLFMNPRIRHLVNYRNEEFARFKKQYYKKMSTEICGYESLKQHAYIYSSILVGSDQLWTPGGLASGFYNLMFVPNSINKISYATSFGVSNIPKSQHRATKEYLSRINNLSVREIRGAEIVYELTGKTAKVVADPTILLSREEWNNIIPNRDIVGEKYIFCYFLGKNISHRKIAEELRSQTGYIIVTTPFLDNYCKEDLVFGDKQLFNVGPDDFVNLIRNAEYVLTDSFHGTIFSLINHKKFIVLNRYDNGNQSRNSRIDSLSKLLNIEKRRYSKNVMSEMMGDIDFDEIDSRLDTLRFESIAFLRNALERENKVT